MGTAAAQISPSDDARRRKLSSSRVCASPNPEAAPRKGSAHGVKNLACGRRQASMLVDQLCRRLRSECARRLERSAASAEGCGDDEEPAVGRRLNFGAAEAWRPSRGHRCFQPQNLKQRNTHARAVKLRNYATVCLHARSQYLRNVLFRKISSRFLLPRLESCRGAGFGEGSMRNIARRCDRLLNLTVLTNW